MALVRHQGHLKVESARSEVEDRHQSCFALVLVDFTTNYHQKHPTCVIRRGFCLPLLALLFGPKVGQKHFFHNFVNLHVPTL